ncbi:MAG: Transcriptional activator spt7 [Piccolia ochrophora]|nr:MAG: Transcriptional activator spt7 [Piccolia ochrophora]
MSSLANNHPQQNHHALPWLPPHVRQHDGNSYGPRLSNGLNGLSSRPRTPSAMFDVVNGGPSASAVGDADAGPEEDPRVAVFRDLYNQSEARIAALFNDREHASQSDEVAGNESADNSGLHDGTKTGRPASAPKKVARAIDEDDYDDYDDGDEDDVASDASPLKAKSSAAAQPMVGGGASPLRNLSSPLKQALGKRKASSAQEQAQSSEEVRKRLEEDKKATEDAAKRSFHTLFYTLENDRDAMLEQQKLEELDRQVEAEMQSHGANANSTNHAAAGNPQQGKLSSANLGASSLTLKHLIARIDAKRDQVLASDAELRSLMSEVRKNRSKWANEDRVGQEELYEAADKVLSELKAMTEHSTAFLTRVNKREAPDYYNIIKCPMDLGSMTKKLKSFAYKSKQDFVGDLNLIWANCLKYNADPSHFLRKHALAMRKETDKLVPLIPDIVIRDRAEVEAEERRMQNGGVDAEIDGGEESDDEPIMSSRGRKAPSKGQKGTSAARKALREDGDGSPSLDAKPSMQALNAQFPGSNIKNELLRGDSDATMEGSQNGFSTPPHGVAGTLTPMGTNGVGAPGSQADPMEIDGFGVSTSALGVGHVPANQDIEHEDLEYKTWKQVTKKDRALVAAERNRLFKGDKLNEDEPALLRTRSAMRRWLKKQRRALAEGATGEKQTMEDAKDIEDVAQSGETLAEGMEGEEERVLPDYYDSLGAIPDLNGRLRWVEDSEGQVVDQCEEYLRKVPEGQFTAPDSILTRKMEANMRQMQETRRVCSKIGVIKQMQLQTQMYQNQFQKYNPEPFVEKDIAPLVVSDDGPVMAPWVCRAALQRSVGKICYHAGFEEFQPSALEAITDIATDFFTKLVRTVGVYREAPKEEVAVPASVAEPESPLVKAKFTFEESILHTLHENGLDIETLEGYMTDEMERSGTKLGVMHERMKAHLAELLRPALSDAGPDGANAFHDGSEQFVGGDFAEDIDEDFFGFKELGLDREFGLASLSVPLHLLQNRMHNAYQTQNTSNTITMTSSLDTPPAWPPVTIQSLKSEIGLVHNFFLAKLHANNDEPLIEDEDLPQKQRFPKPRLPPTGKISSPRKRPLKEQGGNKAKKKKIEAPALSATVGTDNSSAAHPAKELPSNSDKTTPSKGSKLKISLPAPGSTSPMERVDSQRTRDSEKDDAASGVGMMSPESIIAG